MLKEQPYGRSFEQPTTQPAQVKSKKMNKFGRAMSSGKKELVLLRLGLENYFKYFSRRQLEILEKSLR